MELILRTGLLVLSLLPFYVCVAEPKIAENRQQVAASIFLVENGIASDVAEEYLAGRVGAGMNKVTVLGYVKKPGVYLFKEKISVIELAELAGSITLPDGRRSMQLVDILTSDGLKTINLERVAAEPPEKRATRKYYFVYGNEILYRKGLLGLVGE